MTVLVSLQPASDCHVPPWEATSAPSLAALVIVIWEYMSRPRSIAVSKQDQEDGCDQGELYEALPTRRPTPVA